MFNVASKWDPIGFKKLINNLNISHIVFKVFIWNQDKRFDLNSVVFFEFPLFSLKSVFKGMDNLSNGSNDCKEHNFEVPCKSQKWF